MSVERALQFVDSNILVYAHDVSAGAKHERARRLIEELWNTGDGCISIQVLQEFYVSVTRKVSRPLDARTAAQVISDLGQWPVHVATVPDVLEAILMQQRHHISFWDAMILTSATQQGCELVWSEDLNPGQKYSTVHVVNPFAA